MKVRYLYIGLLGAGLGLMLLWLGNPRLYSLVNASSSSSSDRTLAVARPTTLPPQTSISNETCLGCHGKPGLVTPLSSGETLGLYVSSEEYTASVHGQIGYACVQCHTTVGNYPHPPFSAKDTRDASLRLYQACQRCHATQYDQTLDSVHADSLAAGKRYAPICTDCHSAHSVQRLTDVVTHELLPEAHQWIPQTCAKCHNAIYQKYLTSVHGSTLVGAGNPDVPTCIDCHGVHSIGDPNVTAFRINSPQMCSRCHADEKRMGKYGLSTKVLDTYVSDFHGTTILLFEKQSPDAITNKPVCFDCHGIHDIKSVQDPQTGIHIRENMLARCQDCHPTATLNFPDAWLSHYIPAPDKAPLVYNVNLFYKILIPGTLGGMGFLVLLDLIYRIRLRIRTHAHKKETPISQPAHPIESYTASLPSINELFSTSPEKSSGTANQFSQPALEISPEAEKASASEKQLTQTNTPALPSVPEEIGDEGNHG